MARDPYIQREDERAREDDEYARDRRRERADRAAEKAAPLPPACRQCGSRAGTHDGACLWCGAPVKR